MTSGNESNQPFGSKEKYEMDCDWIFLNQDRSRQLVTLNESRLPQVGEGKFHDKKRYGTRFRL